MNEEIKPKRVRKPKAAEVMPAIAQADAAPEPKALAVGAKPKREKPQSGDRWLIRHAHPNRASRRATAHATGKPCEPGNNLHVVLRGGGRYEAVR